MLVPVNVLKFRTLFSSCSQIRTGIHKMLERIANREDCFFSNTGPDPLKIVKLPSQRSILGNDSQASETPYEWSFAGWQMMAR